MAGSIPSAVTVAKGALLGFMWNGTQEIIISIDPSTGLQTVIGAVGDLSAWNVQLAVDDAADRIYVFGVDPNGIYKIYSLLASTAAFISEVPVTINGTATSGLLGVGVNSSGMIVACRWNGTSEDFLSVDPTTGIVTLLGTVGDLTWWSTISALNASDDNYYAIGGNGTQDFLYVMDASIGSTATADRFLYQVPVSKYPSAGFLAY